MIEGTLIPRRKRAPSLTRTEIRAMTQYTEEPTWTPTAEEIAATAAHEAHLARMADLDRYIEARAVQEAEDAGIPAAALSELAARFSAFAAEIAQDARPEPEPPAGGAAAKRSKYDSLTVAERARLYNPLAY